MMVRLTRGRDYQIAEPFMLFKNLDRSYPRRRVPDTVPVVAYRTGPKCWMDGNVLRNGYLRHM